MSDDGARLNAAARAVVTSGRVAHFTTVARDGRPHTTVVWVDLDGDDVVVGKLWPDQKVANIRRDPRVSISLEAEGSDGGLQHYLVVEGRASLEEGGAPELLARLAPRYLGEGAVFPPMDDPPAGFVIRVTPTRVRGVGPWATPDPD